VQLVISLLIGLKMKHNWEPCDKLLEFLVTLLLVIDVAFIFL
jgi:hypothetical protein